MSDEEKRLILATSLPGITAHFGAPSQHTNREDISTTVDRINRQAKKLSAAAHHQLVMNEGKSIGTAVDSLMGELDTLVAERRSYNDFLRKRTEVWDLAAKRLTMIKDRPEQPEYSDISCDKSSLTTGDSSQSFNSSTSRSHSSNELQVSLASNSDDRERKEAGFGLPKRPKLSDYNLVNAVVNVAPKAEFARPSVPALISRPPGLDRNQFQSNVGGVLPDQIQRPILTQMALVHKIMASSNEIRELPKENVPGSFEKHEIAEHRTSDGADGSKRSAGSLTGSFLDDHAVNDYGIVPNAGPLVRSDLGFSDKELLEESTATLSSIGGPVIPTSSAKPNDRGTDSVMTQQSAFKKPVLPKLKTITLGSEAN